MFIVTSCHVTSYDNIKPLISSCIVDFDVLRHGASAQVNRKHASAKAFLEDLKDIKEATRVDLSSVQGDIKDTEKDLRLIEAELGSFKRNKQTSKLPKVKSFKIFNTNGLSCMLRLLFCACHHHDIPVIKYATDEPDRVMRK